MTFWSDVEKEYNELSGDSQTGEEDDPKSTNGEMKGLLSDIRKDLQKIPKSEVIPSFYPSDKKEDELQPEESDSDQEEKKTFSPESKKDKRCIVRGRTFEVGERWKDDKTGKDMICILMSVPKNVQPLLAEAEILATKKDSSVDSSSEWKRPSVEPQWSYTATPKTKQECQEMMSEISGKTSEKPDKIESQPDTKEGKPTASPEITKSVQLDKLDEKTDSLDKEHEGKEENQPQEIPEKQLEGKKEPEIIVVEPETKQNGDKLEDDAKGKKEEEEVSESEEESEIEEPKQKEQTTTNIPIKDEAEGKKDEEESEDGSESELEHDKEITEDKNVKKEETKEIKSEAIKLKDEGKEPVSELTKDLPDNTKSTETAENITTNTQETPETDQPETTQEKGEPIYTKETVVIQRKLIKTEETIETTETEKAKK